MPKKKHSIKTALVKKSEFVALVQGGLGALIKADTNLIAMHLRKQIADSLDLDEATRIAYPQSNRWDYLLCLSDNGYLIALEPHSAKDLEIKVVIAKKKHAVMVLRDHLIAKRKVEKWYWVTQGTVRFGVMERATRLLDQEGIAFKGRQLTSL